MYKQLHDVSADLNSLREQGIQHGKYIGWDFNALPLTIKEGSTTYIGASPASGKTELWFEFLINLSCQYGWRHIVYSPETGTPEEIFAELCYKFIGKPYIKSQGREMNITERTKAEYFIGEHFVIVDPVDADLTIETFYSLCDSIEKDLGKRFHTTTIDPWNELTENYEPNDLGREDKYLSRILGLVRKNARKTNRHNCVINHVRDQAPVTKDGKTYYPMPTARDFAGGQVWFRKGMTVLMIWRPPYGMVGDDGKMFEDNEVHIRVAKAKPKGTAKVGIYKMFLDLERYQYYMHGHMESRVYGNRKTYSYQHEITEELVTANLSNIGRSLNEGFKMIEDKDMPF